MHLYVKPRSKLQFFFISFFILLIYTCIILSYQVQLQLIFFSLYVHVIFFVLNFSSFKNMNSLLIYYIVLRDMLQKLCSIFINKFIFNDEVFYLAPSLIRKKKFFLVDNIRQHVRSSTRSDSNFPYTSRSDFNHVACLIYLLFI